MNVLKVFREKALTPLFGKNAPRDAANSGYLATDFKKEICLITATIRGGFNDLSDAQMEAISAIHDRLKISLMETEKFLEAAILERGPSASV